MAGTHRYWGLHCTQAGKKRKVEMEENQTDQNQMPAQMPQESASPMLSQDQVNKIVAREKLQARESGKREAEEKYQREMEAFNTQRANAQSNTSNSSHVDHSVIEQKVQEGLERQLARLDQEMKERQLREKMSEVANNYLKKMDEGKSSYADFEEVTGNFDTEKALPLVYHLSNLDNGGDVLYDLSKNPNKLANIQVLLHSHPKIAEKELLKLSKSISDNKTAQADAQNQNVSDPLDRLQSSSVAGSNGKKSIRDLRNDPSLRG